jgi:hypothetical protein
MAKTQPFDLASHFKNRLRFCVQELDLPLSSGDRQLIESLISAFPNKIERKHPPSALLTFVAGALVSEAFWASAELSGTEEGDVYQIKFFNEVFRKSARHFGWIDEMSIMRLPPS